MIPIRQQARLTEAIAATYQHSKMVWKWNSGQRIYMAILLLSENRNLDVPEQIIANHQPQP